MLGELPFYAELNILKTWKAFKGYVHSYSIGIIDWQDSWKAFKGYVHSYNIEIIDLQDASIQLAISRSSIKDLIKELLAKIKGSNIKEHWKYKERESVSFKYATKTKQSWWQLWIS